MTFIASGTFRHDAAFNAEYAERPISHGDSLLDRYCRERIGAWKVRASAGVIILVAAALYIRLGAVRFSACCSSVEYHERLRLRLSEDLNNCMTPIQFEESHFAFSLHEVKQLPAESSNA